jgi:1,4-dihydroxy-2-naphthoyl-CoA hydrolase
MNTMSRDAGPTHEDATSFLRTTMPLCATLGMTSDGASAETVAVSIDWAPELCTSGALLHGGVLMALADSAGGACAFLNLPEGAGGTATIESKTNFLGGVKSGTVTAVARPLHVGSTTIVVETEVRNGDRLVAKVTQTQAILRPRT